MQEIPTVTFNNELRVNSRELADRLEIQHHKFVETLNKYSQQLQQLGLITFEREAVKIPGQRGTNKFLFGIINAFVYLVGMSYG